MRPTDTNRQPLSRCPDARALLSGYVEGELTEGERRRVAGHLAICAGCRREEAHYREALGTLQAPPRRQAPGDLYAGFAARLYREEGQARRRQTGLRWASASACLLLVVGAGASFLHAVSGRRAATVAPSAATAASSQEARAIAPPSVATPLRTPSAPYRSVGVPRTVPTDPKPVWVPPAPPSPLFAPAPEPSSRDIASTSPAPEIPESADAVRSAPRVLRPRRNVAAASFLDVADSHGETARAQFHHASRTVAQAARENRPLPQPQAIEEARQRRRLMIVPALDEHVKIDDRDTHVRGESAYDADGKLALIRIKTETSRDPQEPTSGEEK